jgi:glycosyltransferase involved in cell wall biosynthesis
MKVSVIIPAYNSSNTISATLHSLKLQTYQNFDVTIVDDGSTDETLCKVQHFINANQHLKILLIQQVNSGVSKARNVALNLVKGDLIAFLDSDDEWLPNKLERQIQVFTNNPEVDLLGCCRNGELYDNTFSKTLKDVFPISFKMLLFKMFFITPTVIFKRDILKDIGFFNESKKYCEDADYFIKICYTKKCFMLNESLVITGGGKAHFGERGLSSNLIEMEKGELANFKDIFLRKQINIIEYAIIYCFSVFKFFRRILFVLFRKFIS